ncbi:MAG TPA: hypothetical protein PKD19_00345 [Candidatus Saccharibacteria bacterium]|nr:hypothetical protein [Candidatus Saccharibacteria bacterium]HMR38138.1 hypothetical protein [Candidatus Saccharibacteria bacterium]
MSTSKSPVIIWVKKHEKGCKAFLVTLGIVWLITDLIGIGGNIRFYAKWIECGRKPVVSAYVFKKTPHYIENTPILPTIRLLPDQFCSPKEAELAGYSVNESGYDFRYTTDEERQRSYELRQKSQNH